MSLVPLGPAPFVLEETKEVDVLDLCSDYETVQAAARRLDFRSF